MRQFSRAFDAGNVRDQSVSAKLSVMKTTPSLRFDHVAVAVHDAQSACHLFADTLGLPLIAAHTGDDWDGAPWLMMIFGLAEDGQVALCVRHGAKKSRPQASDLPHFALATAGKAQLAAWERKLKAAGFRIRHEDHGDQQSIYFDDRSGLTWEITTARKRSAAADPDARATIDEWISQHS
jgi:catechol 2,3-dioxygenase-like lactoylglutathione lyase family enzyme